MSKKQKMETSCKTRYKLYGNNFRKRRQQLKLSQDQIADKSSILSNKC